ncbi:uncharacterized protein LOC129583071 [Paramacrobiotus metropolitanus]|uniref:uncharacterized protein LOC129583071 n=1 Tax=Paramacrobiotus metropolitanus TaxID=2943436 RepID=UPI0024459919|nr:uncharacterized protein LOC129583071 [Paramacrobiotus metropolitanus]
MSKEKNNDPVAQSGIATAGKYAHADGRAEKTAALDITRQGMEVAPTDAGLTARAKSHHHPEHVIPPETMADLADLDKSTGAANDADFLKWLDANQDMPTDALNAEMNRRSGHDAQNLSDIFTVSALRMFFAPVKPDEPPIDSEMVRRESDVSSDVSSHSDVEEHPTLAHRLHLDVRARREERRHKELQEAVDAEKADMEEWERKIRERHERRMKRRAEREARRKKEAEMGKLADLMGKVSLDSGAPRPDCGARSREENRDVKIKEKIITSVNGKNHKSTVSYEAVEKDGEDGKDVDPEVVKRINTLYPEAFTTFRSPARDRLRQRLKGAPAP